MGVLHICDLCIDATRRGDIDEQMRNESAHRYCLLIQVVRGTFRVYLIHEETATTCIALEL
jgi:hypothetical protein